jgi:fluoride ion exporter CrcB/FEX
MRLLSLGLAGAIGATLRCIVVGGFDLVPTVSVGMPSATLRVNFLSQVEAIAESNLIS